MHKPTMLFMTLCGLAMAASVRADDAAATKKVDPAGEWKWESDYGHGLIRSTLTLKADGDQWTGTYKNDTDSYTLKSVALKGDQLTCDFLLPVNGSDMKIQLAGTIRGNDLSGNITALVNGETTEFDWHAERSINAKQIVGDWKLKVVSDEGQVYTPTVKIEEKEGKLGGTYVTDEAGSFPLKRVATTKDTVEIHTTLEFNGNELVLEFSGKLDGQKLKGTVKYEIGETVGKAGFEGERTNPQPGAE